MEYNRNFFIAITLSLLVIIAWQFFVGVSQHTIKKTAYESTRKEHISSENQTNSETALEISETRHNRLRQQGHRIIIDTPQLKGSINLEGAQIDDLLLKKYHVTVKKTSPEIALLNPGYLAEFGFNSDTVTTELPNSHTHWIIGQNRRLTPLSPVYLFFDNRNGLLFHRKISVDDRYLFTIEDSVVNNTNQQISLSSYGRVSRRSSPHTSNGSYLLHEGLIGVIGDEGLKTKTYKELYEANNENKIINFQKAKGGWIGITDKYWAVTLIPTQNIPFEACFSFNERNGYQSAYKNETFSLSPHKTAKFINHVFAGAKQVDVINNYEQKLAIKKFELLIDWGLLNFITKPMFILIDWLYKGVGNFGVAILLVTVILKVSLFPLANKSYKSMARMKNIQPKIIEIREKYAENKTKQQQLIIELYRNEKINPLAGCWPLVIQFPIFFALYKVLYITIEMRHAPFFGWLQDLAAPDPTSIFNLFGLLPYNVPQFLMIGFWPIIMGITMFLQMRMNPTPPDQTQAILFNWMPLIFTWMLAAFPAGLVIYWAWNNTLSIIQQAIIMKHQGVKIELFDNLKSSFIRNHQEPK
ncbi:MAG: YidC/Oxa1 family membrane protein insertase [Candidatus Tokpelaia sp. JSC161]|jgi:YidC/Oxa1 family membrane protein insertase|nr:MAG: YidC/Oxa1 family membrane protein insertase [Candidatus Tokpelaia sp. JSC161]